MFKILQLRTAISKSMVFLFLILISSFSPVNAQIPPTGVEASDGIYPGQVYITWTRVYEKFYLVWKNTINSTTGLTPVSSQWEQGSSAVDYNIQPGKVYYYFVSSSLTPYPFDTGVMSAPDSGYAPLPAPAGLSATDGGSNFLSVVQVSCNPLPGQYISFFRSQQNNPATASAITGWQSSNTITDATASAGVIYYYWARTSLYDDGHAASGFSNVDQGNIGNQGPAVITASDGNYFDSVKITVSSGTGQFIRFYRNTLNSITGATQLTGVLPAQTIYYDRTATPGLQYFYFIQTYSDLAGSNPSPYSNIDAGNKKLKVPNIFSSAGSGPSNVENYIRVGWDSVAGMHYSKLYRSATDNFATAAPVTGWVTGKVYYDYVPSWGVFYYYWVISSAYNNGFLPSAVSASVAGYMGFYRPWNITVSRGLYTDYCTISWNNIWGNYSQLYRSTTSNAANATAITSFITGITYNDKTAVPGTLYYYWIRSVSNNGSYPSILVRSDTSGYRVVAPPINARGSLGTYTDRVRITWQTITSNPGMYYRVYRNTTNNPNTAVALGTGWVTGTMYDDFTVPTTSTYYYWVKGSNSPAGDLPSAFSSYAQGYKKATGRMSNIIETNTIEISPNPASSMVNMRYKIVEKGTVSISLFNEKGIEIQKVISVQDQAAGIYTISIDISKLFNGIYRIAGQLGNEYISKQIIKLNQ